MKPAMMLPGKQPGKSSGDTMLRTRIAGVLGLVALAALATTAGTARATVLVPADLTDLTRSAHVIVHGRVVS